MTNICSRCVMDTSDAMITFDEHDICDHCRDFDKFIKPGWHTDIRGHKALDKIFTKIKAEGKGKEFDCIMGMSGGVDSSYLLHIAVKDYGLRPLVFHVDGGWNSDISTTNISVMVDKLGLDLYTEVINWEEMKDFQLAYIKSGLPNIDVPQDHAFVATLYNFASKYNIKYILNGGNISTEVVRNPLEWLYYGTDMAQISAIRKLFCTNSLKSFPFSSVFRHKIYLRYIKGIQVIKPLNYVPYVKDDAIQVLINNYGWKPYGQKHFESRFTKFYEGFWLPQKFGYDTRKVQYSSLILTGQMSRDEALLALKKPAISYEEAKHDFDYVAKKLGITSHQLQKYFEEPNKSHKDYPNLEFFFNFGASFLKFIGVEKSIKR